MSFKSEDLLNLSMELAKESSNRIVENQKLKILNMKEQKHRELNEERMIKYFEENYTQINDRIDNINDRGIINLDSRKLTHKIVEFREY